MRALGLSVFVGVVVAGCNGAIQLPPDAQIQCRVSEDCPLELICHNERCVEPGSFESVPPELVAITVDPAVGKAGTTFTFRVEASEALFTPPTLTLRTTVPVEIPCADAEPLHYTCAYLATGLEGEGAGGTFDVDVKLEDPARNRVERKRAIQLRVDLTAPALAAELTQVSFLPAASNPLGVVSAATGGTRVSVSVTADEALGDPAPTLVIDPGGNAWPATLATRSGARATFTFDVPVNAPDGDFSFAVTWTDAVGNTSAPLAVATPAVRVRTAPRGLNVLQSQVTFVNSAQGSLTAETLDGGFVVAAGPHVSLAPSDPLSGESTLPAGTFVLTPGDVAPVRVRVWGHPTDDVLLGTLAALPDGSWPRQKLVSIDVPGAHVSALDEAGNETARVAIAQTEWLTVARAGVVAVPNAREALAQEETYAVPGTAGVDAQLAEAATRFTWRQRSTSALAPPTGEHAMAYDAARGVAVLVASGATYEWDGTAWALRAPSGAGPSSRFGVGLVYDAARGRVLLFGGKDDLRRYQDCWEWDGDTWTDVTPAGTKPSPRWAHALAYDASRAKVVLFGGLEISGVSSVAGVGDTWEWDGSSWTLRSPAVAPAGRAFHSMSYDARRARVLLYGGYEELTDTWEWDGTSWRQGAENPAVAGRAGASLAYDPVRERVVMFGGKGMGLIRYDETWEWDGTAWTARTVAARPPRRGGSAAAWDLVRSRMVIFGGFTQDTGYSNETWTYDGATWKRAGMGAPSASGNWGLTTDTARKRVLLFGGSGPTAWLNELWEWDGLGWEFKSNTGPTARLGGRLAFDSARERTVLFGGRDNTFYVNDTWEWNGTAWTALNPATKPGVRGAHSLTYDATNGRVVLFGGTNSSKYSDTWDWNGSVWTQGAAPPAALLAREDLGLTFDPVRGKRVLFGGRANVSTQSDLWESSGTTWTQVMPAGAKPPGRYWHGFEYVPARGTSVLWGGTTGTEAAPNDLWEWDGTSWRSAPIVGASPSYQERFAYDPVSGSLFQPPGFSLDVRQARRPAVQWSAALPSSLPLERVSGLRIRARCGGDFHPYAAASAGAELRAWKFERGGAPPGWQSLAATSAAPGAPGALTYQSPSAADARALLLERDRVVALQCRTAGDTGPGPRDAKVAADYFELRVRTSP